MAFGILSTYWNQFQLSSQFMILCQLCFDLFRSEKDKNHRRKTSEKLCKKYLYGILNRFLGCSAQIEFQVMPQYKRAVCISNPAVCSLWSKCFRILSERILQDFSVCLGKTVWFHLWFSLLLYFSCFNFLRIS